MAVMDEFKEERASLKNADFKTKLQYFWDYYKWPVIIGIIILIVIIYQIKFYQERKETVFHACLLNAAEIEVSTADDYHTRDFAAYTGIDTENEQIIFDNTMSIGMGNSEEYNSAQKLVVYLSSAELDVMVGDVDVVLRYAYQGDFFDLRQILTEQQMAYYQDYIYYIDNTVVAEAEKAASSGSSRNDDAISYPDPFKPENMKDPIPVGIVITTESPIMKEYYINGEQIVCSVIINTTHLDMCKKFIEYMCILPQSASETTSEKTSEEMIAEAIEAEHASVPEESDPTGAAENDSQVLISERIPDKYKIAVKEGAGTVEAISYMAKDYVGDGEPVEKNAYVYLPAGYDENSHYNVIYLMHGIGGNENEWALNTKNSKLKNILDNLISNKDIEPLIVVTPNGKALACQHTDSNDYFYKFGYELRNDLIPYIESHYATYAEYDENGYDLTATRTHRAMAGLSMGGMQTVNIGLCECLDIMSWFGAFSAAPTTYSASKVASIVDASEYDVDYFYSICGTEDNIAYASASGAAKLIDHFSDKFVKDENYTWQEKTGAHDFNIWYLGIYNFAKLAFREAE